MQIVYGQFWGWWNIFQFSAFAGSLHPTARLCKGTAGFSPTMSLSQLTECTYGGYAPIPIPSSWQEGLDYQGNATLVTDTLLFSGDGSGPVDSVTGAYATIDLPVPAFGSTATATATLGAGGKIASVTVTNGGSGYQIPPQADVTGAPGTGAVLQAVVVNGSISQIDVIEPGTGYVAPVVTVAPPQVLLAGAALDTPVPLGSVGAVLPIVFNFGITPF